MRFSNPVVRETSLYYGAKWHYVYVILSKKDGGFYIGYTRDLRQRLQKHNAKRNFSTKTRLLLLLIYVEACLNEEDAKRREKYLKTTQGRRFLKLRIRKFIQEQ